MKFETYIDAIISAILSFIITILISNRFGIYNLPLQITIVIINYFIIFKVGSYLTDKLKR